MSKDENDFYRVYYKSSTVSFSEALRDLDAVHTFLQEREDRLYGVEIRIEMKSGWDEIERATLKRLKAKYEKEGNEEQADATH